MEDQIITTSHGGNGDAATIEEVIQALPHLGDWLRESLLVDVDLSATWLIQVHWRWNRGERPHPIRVDIRGRNNEPITVPMFNRLPISVILDRSRQLLKDTVGLVADVMEVHGDLYAAASVRGDFDAAKPRRGRKSDLLEDYPNLFVDVARYYRAERRKGTRYVIKAVHNRMLEDPTYTALMQDWGSEIDNRVRGWIDRAKQQNLIDGERRDDDG